MNSLLFFTGWSEEEMKEAFKGRRLISADDVGLIYNNQMPAFRISKRFVKERVKSIRKKTKDETAISNFEANLLKMKELIDSGF